MQPQIKAQCVVSPLLWSREWGECDKIFTDQKPGVFFEWKKEFYVLGILCL